MYRVSHNDDRNESNQNRYSPTIMSPEDVAAGKPSYWPELLIGGKVINLSPRLFCEPFIHLTSLLIENNHIIEIPPEINKLVHLQILNANNNHLMAVPKELGECIELRKLLLANNRIRLIPYELGKLYNIQELDLQKNPLAVEFSNIYHTSNGTHFLQLYLLDHCKGPCLITSRNYGKKVHNTSGYHYRPNFFFYNQWYAPVANVPTAPYATTAYQNESLETQFSRLTLQKHGTPLVLTPSSISPHLLSSPHSSSNIYWRPRNNYNINRFQRKSKPIPQQHLNIENPLLYSIPGCVLPRSSSKRKKRKKRDRNNKSKTVTNDDDRSQDFLSKITSISDIELSLTTDTSSSDTTSNSISCHCCVCDPFGQIWNVEQLMISSPRSKFNSSTSYSTNNNTANTLKNFKTDKEQHRHFEVSSQIITAPNGHKDLEIRLYFSSKKS